MPDLYSKGSPHRPWTTVAGNYLGMQPVGPLIGAKPAEVWYRGDDYAEVIRQRDAWAATREGWEAAIIRIAALEAELALRNGTCAALKRQIDAATRRRPPKRMGDPQHE